MSNCEVIAGILQLQKTIFVASNSVMHLPYVKGGRRRVEELKIAWMIVCLGKG